MYTHRTISAAAASLTLAALALTGCSLSPTGTATSAAAPAVLAIQGTMMGGSTAVTGANIILWESDPGNTGYPSATNENAKVLGGSLTGTGGSAVTTNQHRLQLYIHDRLRPRHLPVHHRDGRELGFGPEQ